MRLTRAQRRRLSWVPISIVAVICIAIAVGAVAIQGSWWTASEQAPSSDQVAEDGMSVFTGAGLDYLTRDGVMRIKTRTDSRPATELGLAPNGPQTFEPLVPVRAVVLGEDGVLTLELVNTVTIATENDRVVSVELVPVPPTSWTAALAQLRDAAAEWGWTDDDFARLEEQLTSASQQGDGRYSARLPTVEYNGANVSAEVVIRGPESPVTLLYTVSTLAH